MNIAYPDRWPETPAAAIALQTELRSHIHLEDELPPTIHYVAGVDAGFEREGTITRAAVAVLEFPSLALVDSA